IVGAAGRLSPEKGFGYLVAAAAAAAAQLPDLGFILFGTGPLRESLAADIRARGLEGRFILAGFREDIGTLLPHVDAVVLPSLTEGLPVVLLEAMAAGRPVVATNVGGIPEVVDDGVTGKLVAPASAAELADGIISLFTGAVDRAAMGEAGRERVRRDFFVTTQCVKYQALFERLAARKRPHCVAAGLYRPAAVAAPPAVGVV
ncbi:MAG: glycosyltransferase, partial [Gemmataceae bacterium]|nr:glycosyltransferase [Gemmataceae bacterium]